MFESPDLSRINIKNQRKYIMEQTEDLRESVNYNSFFLAEVVNTNDDYNLGRVTVRIPALHGINSRESIYTPDSGLPWARPGSLTAAGNDMGQFIIPEKGSKVFVTFEYNSPQNPIYFGGVPTLIGKPKEYNDNPDIYDKETIEITDDDKIKDLKNNKAIDILYKSFKGSTVLFDDKDGQEKLKIISADGQVFEMGVKENPDALPRRGDKEISNNLNRYMKLSSSEEEYIELESGKISIVAPQVEISGLVPPETKGDLNYVHIQTEPISEWDIIHNLDKLPSVTILNSANDQIFAEVNYIDKNQVKLKFSGALSGKATLN